MPGTALWNQYHPAQGSSNGVQPVQAPVPIAVATTNNPGAFGPTQQGGNPTPAAPIVPPGPDYNAQIKALSDQIAAANAQNAANIAAANAAALKAAQDLLAAQQRNQQTNVNAPPVYGPAIQATTNAPINIPVPTKTTTASGPIIGSEGPEASPVSSFFSSLTPAAVSDAAANVKDKISSLIPDNVPTWAPWALAALLAGGYLYSQQGKRRR
jgi:hypothetical protein